MKARYFKNGANLLYMYKNNKLQFFCANETWEESMTFNSFSEALSGKENGTFFIKPIIPINYKTARNIEPKAFK